MPTDTGNASGGAPWATVKEWVTSWAEMDARIKELKALIEEQEGTDPSYGSGEQVGAWVTEMDELRSQRRDLSDDIVSAVNDKPKLWSKVVEWGFNESILQSRSDTTEAQGGSGGTGGTENSSGATEDDDEDIIDLAAETKKKKDEERGPDHNLLPGVAGKDFEVRKGANGKFYVVYDTDVPGTQHGINFMYEIDAKDLKSGAYGVAMKDVAKGLLTRREIRNRGGFFNFGNVDEIKRGKGGNKHPFSKFLDLLVEQHPNASWLKSREVMRVMLQAKMEGRGSEWTDNMLRQTKWWNKLTTDERAWEETADAEKAKQRDAKKVLLTASLDAAFGPNVKWDEYIDDERLSRWVEAIASGRVDPSKIADRITSIAEKVEGTAAFTSLGEEGRSLQDSLSDYDSAFAYVRDKAIEWLGYHGKPDQSWIENTTRQVMSGKIGEAELLADLRGKKQALFNYLAPDETWMSRAATYKSVFEEMTGTTIGYDDNVLRDFTARDSKGNPIKDQAMTLDDYERYIKLNDSRWRTSDNFTDQRQGLVNLIQQTFTGVGGGF